MQSAVAHHYRDRDASPPGRGSPDRGGSNPNALARRRTTRLKAARRKPRRRSGPPLRLVPAPMFVIAAANAFVGLDLTAGAVRAFGHAPSLAERFLHEVRALPDFRLESAACELPAWDAAFVHHVGCWALYGGEPPRSQWPLPPLPTAQAIADLAGHRGWLASAPVVGDLFLQWSDARARFIRTGIVVTVAPTPTGDPLLAHQCEVIEGCTSPDRAHDGPLVLRHRRWFGDRDRFVRWTRPKDARDFDPAQEAEDE